MSDQCIEECDDNVCAHPWLPFVLPIMPSALAIGYYLDGTVSGVAACVVIGSICLAVLSGYCVLCHGDTCRACRRR